MDGALSLVRHHCRIERRTMPEPIDWTRIRATAYATAEPPGNWPKHVRPISLNGLNLLGIGEDDRLYWDGKEIQMRRRLRLTWWQGLMISIGALGAAAQGATAVLMWLQIKPPF